MLVLARKEEESILIGDNIHVKVISIEKGVVKLGIEAPSEVTIIRDELARDVADINMKANKQARSQDIGNLSEMLRK